jgi:hypothetical protein
VIRTKSKNAPLSRYAQSFVDMGRASGSHRSFAARRRVAERVPHVDDRETNALAPLGTEPVVEHSHARLGAIGAAKPDRPPAFQVADHNTVSVPFADGNLVDADHLRSWLAGACQLHPHVLLIELLYRFPIEVKLLGNVLDRRLAAASVNEVGKSLGVKGIVGQKLEPLPPHFAARFAMNASDLELQIRARVAAREIAHAADRAIVPGIMQRSAIGAVRFF